MASPAFIYHDRFPMSIKIAMMAGRTGAIYLSYGWYLMLIHNKCRVGRKRRKAEGSPLCGSQPAQTLMKIRFLYRMLNSPSHRAIQAKAYSSEACSGPAQVAIQL